MDVCHAILHLCHFHQQLQTVCTHLNDGIDLDLETSVTQITRKPVANLGERSAFSCWIPARIDSTYTTATTGPFKGFGGSADT